MGIIKNILFLHSSSELYGSDRSLLNIIKQIDKSKFNCHVVLPCDGPLVHELKAIRGVKVIIFEVAVLRRKNLSFFGFFNYVKDFFGSYAFLRRYIKRNSIDIVDTNTAVVFPGAVAARHLGKKNVWHMREIIKSNFENSVISFIMNRYADAVVANSKATARAIKVKRSKIRVVYNAVEVVKPAPTIPHDAPVIGMAGRINRWKGQKLFVDAAEIVLKKYPQAVFRIAGDVYSGEEYIKEDLIKYIGEKGLSDNIILLGQVDDMPSFYDGLDIFVLPSIQPEPFGLVVIEAMMHELPVVATNHGGPTEIITDGRNGFLVDYKNAREMAEKILFLAENDSFRIDMGKAAAENAVKKYSVPAMVRKIENIFNSV